ncbi:probable methyltransferase pmt27 [Phtheirospermum japonicum]|uniref:Methyltransferase n=1 Tax=Phtheirospermum japonicum TaxID=374723 RepID=A0A830CT78_9LAMI|nr:probable methyltransferase pmt27 [Phtheirospermum japonicum]
MTQRQEAEERDENRHIDPEEIKVNKGEITDEDNQQRVDDHQQREDDQIQTQRKQEWQSRDPNGAISDAQIEHDEAPIDTDDTSTSQVKNSETNHKTKNDDEANEDNSEIPKETKNTWSTQADQSKHEKVRRKSGSNNDSKNSSHEYTWQLCNATAGADYIPCLDNEKVISKLHSRKHHEHRERHCPDEPPTCLVPLPKGYKTRIEWPQSRDKIWYHNVPHTTLAEVKGHQNWVKVTGEFLTFPGGGTQFIHGALHYIDFLQEAVTDIAWGKHSRVVLDVGCGVASFGGYLFERDVLALSFAPKDEHEAQVQMALERGIPAISAVMGSQRLPFPSRVFDIVHCARCRVPWHADGGALLLELNRVLRPGGYFVWSATPVYQKLEEDVQIWNEMSNLTVAMCWELVTIKKDTLNSIGAAIYQKPDSNDCYEQRKQNRPPMCKSDDDPNAAWYIPLQSCMHRVPLHENERGSQWPEEWPDRLQIPPYWLNKTQMGIYGKPAPDDFTSDYKHWKKMVSELYMNGLGISWSHVRNVMDMRAVYGGFAAALKDLKVWVMNVVNVDSPDTLPIIYERGLFGIYHNWCESFSTYPRTYDLLHADHLFSSLKKRCKLVTIVAEIDRIVRPGGKLIVRDDSDTIAEIEDLLKSLHWKVYFAKNQDAILGAQKTEWRPDS